MLRTILTILLRTILLVTCRTCQNLIRLILGFQLQQELALREKQKEVDKAERASDLGTANRKKEEYEVMVEQFKQQQLMMKDYLKDDYEQVLKSQRIDKHQRKA